MFTVQEIKAAHARVRSGADFPQYIRDMRELGVTYYEMFVYDGHADYFGANGYRTSSQPVPELLTVAETCNAEQFNADLKAHQAGQSTYAEFRRQCAGQGIAKWTVCLERLTCTYYDLEGNEILIENIPA